MSPNPDPRFVLAAVLAPVFVGAPINYKAPSLVRGGTTLLAHLRLHGGGLLWALLLACGEPPGLPVKRRATVSSPTLNSNK